MSETNGSIQELLDRLVETKESDLAHEIIARLQSEIVILPAIMPKDASPEQFNKLKEYAEAGKDGLPEGIQPNPCVLEDNEGKKLFPVFTSEREMGKDPMIQSFPILLHLPFAKCVQMLEQTKEVRAIVVNPFSHNMRIDFSDKKEKADDREESDLGNRKITEPQFHALVRQHVEATLLPKRLFEEGEALFREIAKEGQRFLLSLYEPPYAKKQNCPYRMEDFDSMTVMIRDDLQITRLTLPDINLYVGTCSSVFLVWNPIQKEAAYYAIVLKPEKKRALYQAYPDGTNREIGNAPEESSELQAIIDLYS